MVNKIIGILTRALTGLCSKCGWAHVFHEFIVICSFKFQIILAWSITSSYFLCLNWYVDSLIERDQKCVFVRLFRVSTGWFFIRFLFNMNFIDFGFGFAKSSSL